MDERAAIAALVSDLHWQMDQMKPRGITDKSGNPYNPSYFRRGLKNAMEARGLAVAEFVRSYVYKTPSAGYKKLEEADSLDLVCEWLVADDTKPYAHLFTDEDRAAARKRLAPRIDKINARKAAVQQAIDDQQAKLPSDMDGLQELASDPSTTPEHAVAVNLAILEYGEDAVALIRLGRGYEALQRIEDAIEAFKRALAVDPQNTIAAGRLERLQRLFQTR